MEWNKKNIYSKQWWCSNENPNDKQSKATRPKKKNEHDNIKVTASLKYDI